MKSDSMSNMSTINKNAIVWLSVDGFSKFLDLNTLEFSEKLHEIKIFLGKALKVGKNSRASWNCQKIIIFYPLGLTFKANLGHFWPSYISEIWFLCSFKILTDLKESRTCQNWHPWCQNLSNMRKLEYWIPWKIANIWNCDISRTHRWKFFFGPFS